MKLPDFKVEQWMNDYETKAVYNLTDTTIAAVGFRQLEAADPGALDDVVLDYGTIRGDRGLQKQILSLYQNQSPDTLAIADGCLEANFSVLHTLLEKGDLVGAFVPGYQQFYDLPASLGCKVQLFSFDEKDWSAPISEVVQWIESENPKLLILNNPANPTGTLFEKEQLEALIDACRRKGTWILCDEAYLFPSLEHPSVSDLYEKGISTSSLSKTMGLAGLRIGWMKGPEEFIRQIYVRNDYTMISTGAIRDVLARIALEHKEVFLKRARDILSENKKIVSQWLEKQDLFSCHIPQEGTTGFMKIHKELDDVQFCKDLLEDTGIFFVPGSCFDKPGYVRIGFGQKQANLENTLDVLLQYTKDYH